MKKVTLVLVSVLVLFSAVSFGDLFWGAGYGSGFGTDGDAAIFSLDTVTGTVGTTHVFEDWNWVMGLAYADGNLYATHNTLSDAYTMKIAKIDPATGSVLSDTAIYSLTGTDIPITNSLHYKDGKLYGIENNQWGSGYSAGAMRGYVYEFGLDGSGDPISATAGAYVGGAPDGALTYKDGTWYASDWNTSTSSSIMTSTDIMNTDFASANATQGVGYFSGWDFETDGDLLGVSWYNSNFNVYDIDLTSGSLTSLYDIGSQLPSSVEQLGALTTPEPGTMILLGLGGVLLRRRK
jgi:hypothetical protein